MGGTTRDGLFTLNATRCLGACGLAPVMTINEEVYGRLVPDDIPGILAKYKRVSDPMRDLSLHVLDHGAKQRARGRGAGGDYWYRWTKAGSLPSRSETTAPA